MGPLYLALVLIGVALGSLGAQANDQGVHPGYLEDVTDERSHLAKEVVILPPEEKNEVSLRDQIFTEKVSREFKMRYEERFGQTQVEQVKAIPQRFFETEILPGQFRTAEEDAQQQRAFGSFMMRRLVEVHVDKYMRESPSARPVYELKEKVSNLDVQVKPGYKFKFKYSLSSNDLDLSMENPYKIRNKITFRMGGGASAGADTLLFFSYPYSKEVELLSSYSVERNEVVLSGLKRLN